MIKKVLFGAILFSALFGMALADDFESANFTVKDPVIFPAGYSTSQNYALWGTIAQPAIATSTSAGFEVRSGFLYFTDPVPTPAPSPAPSPAPAAAARGESGGILGLAGLLLGLPSAPYLPHLPIQISKCGIADFNCDKSIGLRDISVFLYLSAFSEENNPADLNKDGRISLADLSAMLFYWTEPILPPRFVSVEPDFYSPRPRGLSREQEFVHPGAKRSVPIGVQRESNLALVTETIETVETKPIFTRIKEAVREAVSKWYNILIQWF